MPDSSWLTCELVSCRSSASKQTVLSFPNPKGNTNITNNSHRSDSNKNSHSNDNDNNKEHVLPYRDCLERIGFAGACPSCKLVLKSPRADQRLPNVPGDYVRKRGRYSLLYGWGERMQGAGPDSGIWDFDFSCSAQNSRRILLATTNPDSPNDLNLNPKHCASYTLCKSKAS